MIHFPESFDRVEQARMRLAFNEVFFMQYYLALTRQSIRKNSQRPSRPADISRVKVYTESLGFTLTADQVNSIDEIIRDLGAPFPMNRMLQGDVGSGKTVVAIATSLYCISCGEQVAIMAPTEILAAQHYATAIKTLPQEISCRLLTGSMKQKEKDTIINESADGRCKLLIGTHSLIQESVTFRNLGYIVIDEQHRFGVEQRAALRRKGDNPDLLVMTATPIPRSLSLTVYGDLDISSIRLKPPGREPVRTFAFPESRLGGVYNSMRRYIEQGRQIYYVLPLIEESEKSDLKSAVETFNMLKSTVFPDRRLELMHSRLKQKEKNEVMAGFRSGEVDILVTTSVIEVGVDVPNASVIIIHHAERFGLAQLHQLRGRVGRGSHQSFCVLIYPDHVAGDSLERIKIMTETDDGFIIAERDLHMRGDGQLIGTRQHGATDFEFMNPGSDMDIILAARSEAVKIAETVSDPDMELLHSGKSSGMPSLQEMRTGRVLAILS